MKYKILIVEDDQFLAGMYVDKLENEGVFEVEQAANGKEALKKVEADMPDLILLDIMLPAMSGIEVLKNLKANKDTRNIAVIMLTNLNEKEYIQDALSLGADDYLIKAHFLPSEVIIKIKRVLAGKSSQ